MTWSEMGPTQQKAVLDWLVHTVLTFGGGLATAYRVAALFAAGLDREMESL